MMKHLRKTLPASQSLSDRTCVARAKMTNSQATRILKLLDSRN